MNWRRGLIRLWLVSSLLWVVPVGWLTWSGGNTDCLLYAYTTVTDPGRMKRDREAWQAEDEGWRVNGEKTWQLWRHAKAHISANHGLQLTEILTLADAEVLHSTMGGALHHHAWDEPDFCAEEFNGVATAAECNELKEVADNHYSLELPPEPWRWSAEPLIEWSGPVFIPPIAVLLIGGAFVWALRGFRKA
jgi:hypothetical protein